MAPTVPDRQIGALGNYLFNCPPPNKYRSLCSASLLHRVELIHISGPSQFGLCLAVSAAPIVPRRFGIAFVFAVTPAGNELGYSMGESVN